MAMKNNNILIIMGIFFIALGVLAIAMAIRSSAPYLILWMCYLSLLLIGISILRRNPVLLVSQLNILTIPLLLWTIDFFALVIYKSSFFGIVDYFFKENLLARFISFQHVFTLPLSYYALSKMKKSPRHKNIWLISFFQLVIIFIIVHLLTQPSENVNCVYYSCINVVFGSYYPVLWFILGLIMVAGTNQIIDKLPFTSAK